MPEKSKICLLTKLQSDYFIPLYKIFTKRANSFTYYKYNLLMAVPNQDMVKGTFMS